MVEREFQFKEKVKEFLTRRGFLILKEMPSSPGDLIVENKGKKIVIELKVKSGGVSDLTHALGQLLVARFRHLPEESWLVIDSVPTVHSRDIIEVFKQMKIKIFCLIDDKLKRITSERLQIISSRVQVERCKKILEFMEGRKEGVTLKELSVALDIPKDSIRHIIKGLFRKEGKTWGGWLRDKLLLEHKIVKPIEVKDEGKEKTKSMTLDEMFERLREQNKNSNYTELTFHQKVGVVS